MGQIPAGWAWKLRGQAAEDGRTRHSRPLPARQNLYAKTHVFHLGEIFEAVFRALTSNA